MFKTLFKRLKQRYFRRLLSCCFRRYCREAVYYAIKMSKKTVCWGLFYTKKCLRIFYPDLLSSYFKRLLSIFSYFQYCLDFYNGFP